MREFLQYGLPLWALASIVFFVLTITALMREDVEEKQPMRVGYSLLPDVTPSYVWGIVTGIFVVFSLVSGIHRLF